jgi:Mg2+ and Co2+ transporter CorA
MKTKKPKMTREQYDSLINAFDKTIEKWNAMPDDLKEEIMMPKTPKDYVFDPARAQRGPDGRVYVPLIQRTVKKENDEMYDEMNAEMKRLCAVIDSHGKNYRSTIDRMQTVINEKTDLIARLRGCLDKERDAYARLAKRLDRMREKFPRVMESIENAIDEEAGE